MSQLIPNTHILQTFRNSGMKQDEAVAEFIDNSFAPDAGDASEFHFYNCRSCVIFWDNGKGIGDVNLMFELAGSASKHSKQDIGSFGVGAKIGALVYGDMVEVHTFREGKYYHYKIDWKDVLDSGEWPTAYDGKPYLAKQAPAFMRGRGTAIKVSKLNKSRRRVRPYKLAKTLALKFGPGLRKNKKIYLCDNPKSNDVDFVALKEHGNRVFDVGEYAGEMVDLAYFKAETLAIDGKLFNVEIGALPEYDSKLQGIHISFGHRVIETLKHEHSGRSLPLRYYASVDLNHSWKTSLNYNKTRISNDRDDLLEAVEHLSRSLIDKLEDEKESRRTELFNTQVSNSFVDLLNLMDAYKSIIKGTHKLVEGSIPKQHSGGKKGGDGKHDVDKDQGGDHDHASGRFIVETELSKDLGKCSFVHAVDIIDGVYKINIKLNELHDKIEKIYNTPVNGPALISLTAIAMADLVNGNESLKNKLTSSIEETYGEINISTLYSYFINNMEDVKEPKGKDKLQ